MPKVHKLALAIMLVMAVLLSSTDILGEFSDFLDGDASVWHVLLEVSVILLAVAILVVLYLEAMKQKQEQLELAKQLTETKKQLEASHILLKEGKKHFRKLIEWQFRKWSLTKSEKAIAFLLLKGLSFKEIAELRHTQEKTVRHHASSIYSKSGLSGRHALSAWFFEDLL